MNVGTSSVLVAFVLLCLVTFAGLSFLSANSDYGLSKQTAEKTTDYYNAAAMADEQLVIIDDILKEVRAQNPDEGAFYAAAASRINDIPQYGWLEDGDRRLISFLVNMNDRQDLNVTLHVLYQQDQNASCFEITSYNVGINESWQKEV